MNKPTAQTDTQNIITALHHAGLHVAEMQDENHHECIPCYYTCNTDGSIRWVWPKTNQFADFLKFYHSKGWRALAFTMLMKWLFKFRLQKFIAKGQFNLYADLSKAGWRNYRWALFTGTIGPNRKMILWKQRGNGEQLFFKLAITPNAQHNIKQEAAALVWLQKEKREAIAFPAMLAVNENILKLEDVSNDVSKTNDIAALPQFALQQWSMPTKESRINETNFWKQITGTLSTNDFINDKRIAPAFIKKLQQLSQQVDASQTIALAASHGDFTPWNIWIKENKLCMIDWELFNEEAPALTDVFHFVYQSNILIGNKGYAAIRTQLDALFNQQEWKIFLQQHKLDVAVLEQLYLLKNITYYLQVYSKQPNWHVQVQWLMQTWNEALTHCLETSNKRKLVLNDISILLHNVPYAAMKFTEEHFENVSEYSDIDVCISKQHAKQLILQLKKHELVETVKSKSFSHMKQLTIQLKNGQLIFIDCINALKRKSIEFMNANEVIAHAVTNAYGIKTASIEHDFTYTWLFYWLNAAAIPARYQTFFNNQPEEAHQQLNAYLLKSFEISNYKNLFEMGESLSKEISFQIHSMPANKGFRGFINKLNYSMDIIKKLFPQKGFIITFSGVDGAGKSTVIENMKLRMEKKFRKQVVVIRHRPSILPILSAWKHGKKEAELKAATRLPRQGNNKSSISSFIRFAYYYADYLFGQFYIYTRYVLRGYVVLYDRYYFDFINDSKRSNINLPKSFTIWWYRFLLKPKFNFFLYAKADEILARKKELDAPTITLLTEQYLSLFKKLSSKYKSSKYTPIYNSTLSVTLDTIESTIK